jgi:hypothetical protein
MTIELNAAPREMSLAPVDAIVTNLDRIYGRKKWPEYELETISLDLGFALPELLQDKLNVLQLLVQNPDVYYNDVLFYLHASSVFNNNIADFDTFAFPSSLELAFAHTEAKKLFGEREYGSGVKKTVHYILTLEGYSKYLSPFDEMKIGIPLVEGQTEEDTNNKQKAITKYIETMQGEPQ